MSKKYLGILVSLIGFIGLIIFNGIVKIYGIIANYQELSFLDVVWDNFLFSYIILTVIILVGIYLIAKDKYN